MFDLGEAAKNHSYLVEEARAIDNNREKYSIVRPALGNTSAGIVQNIPPYVVGLPFSVTPRCCSHMWWYV